MKYFGRLGEGDALPRWGIRWMVRREYTWNYQTFHQRSWISVGIYLALGRFIGKIQFAIET